MIVVASRQAEAVQGTIVDDVEAILAIIGVDGCMVIGVVL